MTDTAPEYRLLGRTGLRVSPLALGAMTFGRSLRGTADWGAGEDAARAIYTRYLDTGGNFVDTANVYAGGASEELLGKFFAETGTRDRVVLATKFTNTLDPTDPNAGGNGRKNILASLDGSLRRLGTDYVDLYWLHLWDLVTPVEEVMATLDTLVRSGKVRAIGLSDVPAWYATKAQLLAQHRGWEPVAALQLEYSLVERNIEREHVPAAADLGLGIVPWSPLAGGFLTGKYTRAGDTAAGAGRMSAMAGMAFATKGHEDAHWAVHDELVTVAAELGRTPAQIALNWVATRPGVDATLIGARTPEQLDDNLAALAFDLPAELRTRLDEVSAPPAVHPYNLFDPAVRARTGLGGPLPTKLH
jgi:aryl-alcohol dehydrogenase-like predicted oxidoreductase